MEGVFDVLFDGVKEEKAREPKYILGSPKLKGSDDILTEFPDRALEALSLLFHAFKKHCGHITLFPENRFHAVNLSKEIRTADAKLLFVLLPRVLPPEDLLKMYPDLFESVPEFLPALLVKTVYQLLQLLPAGVQILNLLT